MKTIPVDKLLSDKLVGGLQKNALFQGPRALPGSGGSYVLSFSFMSSPSLSRALPGSGGSYVLSFLSRWPGRRSSPRWRTTGSRA